MKQHIKGIICAMVAFGAAAHAAGTVDSAQILPQQTPEKPYFDMNLLTVSYAWMMDINSGLTINNVMGGTITAGQSFGETSQSYHTWYAQTGYLFGKGSEEMDTYYGARLEQSIIPVLMGYTYHYKLTEQLSAYAGAQAGFYYSKTHKSVENNFIRVTHTKFAPTVGVEVGATYKLSKRVSWDIGVQLNNTFSLDKETDDHFDIGTTSKNAVTTTIHTGILFTF